MSRIRQVCRAEKWRAERLFGRSAIPYPVWRDLPGIAEDWPTFLRTYRSELLSAPVLWAFLQQVEEIRASNPIRALELAERASFMAPDLRARRVWRDRVVAQGAIVTGGALKTVGEFDAARGAYAAAHKVLYSGGFLAVDRLDLDIRKIALYVDLRDFEYAERYAARARTTADSAAPSNRQLWLPRALVMTGFIVNTYAGPEPAFYRQALKCLTPDDLSYYLAATTNLAFVLNESEAESPAEIAGLTRKAIELSGPQVSINAAHLQWIQARACQKIGDIKPAEHAYRLGHEYFIGLGIPYYAAGICLDLSAMYLTNNQCKKAEDLSKEILQVMGLYSEIEACKALHLYIEAAKKSSLSVGLVESIRHSLELIRQGKLVDPSCPPRPA